MAQRSRSNWKAYKDTEITTNGAGAITGAKHNALLEDLADSVAFLDEDTDLRYFFQEDFVGAYSLTTSTSGTGSSAGSVTTGMNTTENCLGVIGLSTGTTTTGRAIGYTGSINTGLLLGLGFTIKLKFRATLSAASDGTDTYTAYVGMGDNNSSGDNTDGCYFRYTHSVNSGKWEAVTSGTSTRTATDTGVSPSATVNQIFTITATDSSVSFDIDGTTVSNTTNLPDGASEFFNILFKIEKSAGTTSRQLSIDWYDLLITRSSAR